MSAKLSPPMTIREPPRTTIATPKGDPSSTLLVYPPTLFSSKFLLLRWFWSDRVRRNESGSIVCLLITCQEHDDFLTTWHVDGSWVWKAEATHISDKRREIMNSPSNDMAAVRQIQYWLDRLWSGNAELFLQHCFSVRYRRGWREKESCIGVLVVFQKNKTRDETYKKTLLYRIYCLALPLGIWWSSRPCPQRSPFGECPQLGLSAWRLSLWLSSLSNSILTYACRLIGDTQWTNFQYLLW